MGCLVGGVGWREGDDLANYYVAQFWHQLNAREQLSYKLLG